MFNSKGLVVLFLLGSGSLLAQQTISVTFKSDATVNEPIEITLGRETKTLPAFTAPGGSSVTFSSGLRFNANSFLDAIARQSNLKSKSYTFSVIPSNPTVTITVSIDTKLPPTEQIVFNPSSGRLLPRTAGL